MKQRAHSGQRRSVRPAWAAAVVLAAALAAAPPAGAHARLVATDPRSGAVLAHAPERVTFTFDEGVRSGGDARLSGGGLARSVSLATRLESGGTVLVARLPARLADGDYVVSWRAVSDDGHVEAGALAFGVGKGTPAPQPVAAQRTERDLALGAARWIFLAGALAAAGIAAVRVALGRREPELAAGALAGALAVAGFGGLFELSRVPSALGTRFGTVTLVAAVVAFAGVVAALVALTRPRLLAAAEAAGLALVVAPPLAGHALAGNRQVWLALPADLVHTAAASVWIGGVAWVGLLALRGGLREARGFARIALAAVAVLGASGIARAAAELRSVDEVWMTSYGRLLATKTALFALLLAAGAVSSRLAAEDRLSRFRLSLGGEALLLAGLLAAVAGLGSVTPPRDAAAAAPATPIGSPVVFGRQVGALAVGIAAGVEQGQLRVQATVLGETGDPQPGLEAELSADGGPWQAAQACGVGLYCGSAPASGPAPEGRLRIAGSGTPAQVVSFSLPARPRHALARRIVAAAAVAVRQLTSVEIHERLAADPSLTLLTDFTIEAPDEMRYRSRELRGRTLSPAGAAVVIGSTRWDRARPDAPWTRSALQPLDQPVPDWRDAVDASLLGTGRVRGRPVWIVGFRDPTVPAWFEVAVDRETSRPLRVRMTAAAHFMVRDWGSFDEPVEIRPPTGR